jgi:multisubunit Na+/H+ antiporter MnhB subunit
LCVWNYLCTYAQKDEVGWLGFASIAVGCTVGLIIARIADLWFLKRLKTLMLILSGVAGLCFLWLSGSVGNEWIYTYRETLSYSTNKMKKESDHSDMSIKEQP